MVQNTQPEAVYAYRRRFRLWTMQYLPTMPPDQWAQLLAWVTAWDYETTPRQTRRRKKARRDFEKRVTAYVTIAQNTRRALQALWKRLEHIHDNTTDNPTS